MDPQSQSFTPYSNNQDTWRLQTDVVRIQQIQQEHAERLSRLERRQDEDARVKSVWGASSPFPSVLGGTPQQAPLQQPSADHFRDFDEEANALMSSLHLDAEDEPRRALGAASRANSVRFDETANQNHFAPSHRNSSVDLFARANSGLGGGLHMNERSGSHKSDGRASSAHSMRSAASGRANSLNLDSGYIAGDTTRSLHDAPALAPGLLLLGSVPAIIRCWMNTNFKHDALLYAAVCTGSFKSMLDMRLIHKLGFEDDIETSADGTRTIELPVYFPEAVPHPASSRSSSPAPQLPTLTVDFQVVEYSSSEEEKAIQIFLGSDTMRAHSADILFSSNSITLFDDDRSKLSIPLVRPENEATFNTLRITSDNAPGSRPTQQIVEPEAKEQVYPNGLGQGDSGASVSSAAASPPLGKYRPPVPTAMEPSLPQEPLKSGTPAPESDTRPVSRQSTASRPSLSILNTRAEAVEPQPTTESTSQATPSRSGSGSAIWGSWRREAAPPSATTSSSQQTGLDWAGASKNRETQYQRKETGIKVLKPKSSSSRAASTSVAPSSSSALHSGSATGEGRSRFFDEGRRRSDLQPAPAPAPATEKKENQAVNTSSSPPNSSVPAVGGPAKPKPNPIGGGSAFSWLPR